MQSLTQILRDAGYANRVFTEKQLSRLLGGGDARRYGLVNRALKADELIRIRRGLYLFADRYRDYRAHPFRIAQALYPGSYVSLETALAYHGWIPEASYVTASIVPDRKSKEFTHSQLGLFTFHPLAVNKTAFLELVDRIQVDKQTMLVAQPVRALMDLICFRKTAWQSMEWIEGNLRIDRSDLATINSDECETLKSVYKNKSVQKFLENLQAAIANSTEQFSVRIEK